MSSINPGDKVRRSLFSTFPRELTGSSYRNICSSLPRPSLSSLTSRTSVKKTTSCRAFMHTVCMQPTSRAPHSLIHHPYRLSKALCGSAACHPSHNPRSRCGRASPVGPIERPPFPSPCCSPSTSPCERPQALILSPTWEQAIQTQAVVPRDG